MYPAFRSAVGTCLGNWNALQFALQQQTGGPQTKAIADWMVGVVEQFFYDNAELDPEEVGEFLCTLMDQELHTLVEDQSDYQVGQFLCRLFKLCTEGKEAQVLEEVSKMPQLTLGSYNIQEASCEENDDVAPNLVEAQMSGLQLNEENGFAASGVNEDPHRELTELEKQQLQDQADGWTVIRRGNRR